MNFLNTPMRVYKEARRKEEREELEQRIAENRKKNTDIVEISEDGKVLLKDDSDPAKADLNSGVSVEAAADTVRMEPVIYFKTGEAGESCAKAGTCISISV